MSKINPGLIKTKLIQDPRGLLTVGEFNNDIPFIPKRYFLVFDVPGRQIRGEHAHRKCHQFLVCVKGSIEAIADDGVQKIEFVLNEPNMGLYLPPMTWGVQHNYSPDAALLVFASDYYEVDDYIRDYDQFLSEKLSL
jgi:dTDP-4-dehydrorhamnose 3,5-epimerase-like enzyme